MVKRDFYKSDIDSYLFFNKKYIIITYVDDCLVFCKDEKVLKFMTLLKNTFVLIDEENLTVYLST